MQVVKLKLKEMIEKNGYSQREFAMKAGIRYPTVTFLCGNRHLDKHLGNTEKLDKNGKPVLQSIPFEDLAICCELLHCDISDLMELVEIEGVREIQTTYTYLPKEKQL